MLLVGLAKTEYEQGRQTEYFIFSVIGLVCAAMLTLIFVRKQPRPTTVDLAAALFFVWVSVSYLCMSPVDASSKYLNLIYLSLLYGSLRAVLPTFRGLGVFAFAVAMLCGLWEAVVGLRQAQGFDLSGHSLFLVTGTFFNPGPYGGCLAVMMSLALSYIARSGFMLRRQINKRSLPQVIMFWLCSAVFALSFVIFFAVMSRAAFVALTVCAAIIIFRKREWHDRIAACLTGRRKRIAAVAVVVAVAAVSVGVYGAKRGSADGRRLIWRVSTGIIAEHPLAGTGYGSFGGEYADAQASYFQQRPDSPLKAVAGSPEYGFNEYLLLGAETGVVGLALFVALMLTAACRMWRTGNRFLYGLVAMAVFAFFSYPFSILPLQTLTILFLASGAANKTKQTVRPDATGKLVSVSCCAIALLVCLMLCRVYRDKVDACRQWQRLRNLHGTQYYGDDAVKEYAALYPMLKDNPRFLFDYGQSLAKTVQYGTSNIVMTEGTRLSSDPMFHNIIGNNHMAVGRYDLAEEAYRRAYAILPNRLYPLYKLMNLYRQTGRRECAEKVAVEIIGFTPKIESSATNDMKREAEKLLRDWATN
jgi:O-antigen ligase